jgi:enoyl-CoA hydratase/carnithine racemase
MVLTGVPIPAEEGLAIGLLNRVVSPQFLMETAFWFAERITQMSPIAVQAAKRAVNQTQFLSLADGFRYENRSAVDAILSEDFAEGIRAFREKRIPVFRGANAEATTEK